MDDEGFINPENSLYLHTSQTIIDHLHHIYLLKQERYFDTEHEFLPGISLTFNVVIVLFLLIYLLRGSVRILNQFQPFFQQLDELGIK